MSINAADRAISPTHWQARSFPEPYRDRITVLHDGIDTDRVAPLPTAELDLKSQPVRLRAGEEILTFANRNLEPYRGYHIFMRALSKVLAARPNARVVIVGEDGVSYSTPAPAGKTWKNIFLDEVRDRIDLWPRAFRGADTLFVLRRPHAHHARARLSNPSVCAVLVDARSYECGRARRGFAHAARGGGDRRRDQRTPGRFL